MWSEQLEEMGKKMRKNLNTAEIPGRCNHILYCRPSNLMFFFMFSNLSLFLGEESIDQASIL